MKTYISPIAMISVVNNADLLTVSVEKMENDYVAGAPRDWFIH